MSGKSYLRQAQEAIVRRLRGGRAILGDNRSNIGGETRIPI
jgi:hypothetical protein